MRPAPIFLAVLLLAVAGFCAVGFLATFEPTEETASFLAFRVGYAVVGLACLGGAVACLRRAGRP